VVDRFLPASAGNAAPEDPTMQLVCPACTVKNRVPDERLHDEPVCGKCGTALMSPQPVALDDRTFEAYVQGTDLPVVVDYWAEWCGPCRVMAPQFAAAAQQLPDVRFAKVDTEAAPQTGMRHRVRSIPTMVLFHRGQEVGRRVGALPAAEIVDWVRASVR
jgi:thioredoxin 2